MTTEAEAKKLIKEGWIHVLITLEVVGKPQEHVDKTIADLCAAVAKEEDKVRVLEQHIEESAATEDEFFSTFAEIDFLAKNVETLTWIAANYTPASIEIIEPLDFNFSAGDLQLWYNDILHTMHSIGYAHKTQNAELAHYKEQLVKLVENCILLSLTRGPKTPAQLGKDTALELEAVNTTLKRLTAAKRIKMSGEVYSLV